MVDEIEAPVSSNEVLKTRENPSKFYESNAGDGTNVFDHYLDGLRLFGCLGSCLITSFLIGLDQTIVVTILETVTDKFDGYNKIGWIASGYMLTMAIFAATWGKISTIFGRKASILVALLLFEAGSLMCALSSSINILIGGRIFAGIGGGGCNVLTFVLASELVPINKRAPVMSFFGAVSAISSVCGPLIGGAFTQNVSWRWCFYINLPLGGVAAACLILFLNPPPPKTTLREKLRSFDYIGTFLLTSGLVLFLLGITFGGNQHPWNSGAVISLIVVGALISIAFCFWNFTYSKNPVIPRDIVVIPQVAVPILSGFTGFFCFLSVSVYLTTYFQVVQGNDALHTGYHLVPMILALSISSIVIGILIRTTRYLKPYAIFAGVSGAVGFGTMTLLDVDSSSAMKIGVLILPGVSIGVIIQVSIISSQLSAPKSPGSTIMVSALFNFSRSLGGVLGSDLSQVVFNSSFRKYVRKVIERDNGAFGGLEVAQIDMYLIRPSLISSLSEGIEEKILKIMLRSIKNVFYMNVGLSILTMILVLFYSSKRVPLKKDIKSKAEFLKEKEEAVIVEKAHEDV